MTKKILIAIGVILLLVDTVVAFTPKASAPLSASSNINSINLTPSASPGGDTYGLAFNGTTMIDLAGDFINSIGNTVVNDLIQGVNGFSLTLATSTTITPAQFCATTNIRYLGTTALSTTTLPSATSTYATCGSTAGFGAWSSQLNTNDSTNTVNIVAGTGMTFKCETQGVGTTTIVGGCTSSQVSLASTSSAWATGYWDGASSTFVILWGNEYH